MKSSKTVAVAGTAFLHGSGFDFIGDVRDFQTSAVKSLQIERYGRFIDAEFILIFSIKRIR